MALAQAKALAKAKAEAKAKAKAEAEAEAEAKPKAEFKPEPEHVPNYISLRPTKAYYILYLIATPEPQSTGGALTLSITPTYNPILNSNSKPNPTHQP